MRKRERKIDDFDAMCSLILSIAFSENSRVRLNQTKEQGITRGKIEQNKEKNGAEINNIWREKTGIFDS